MARNPDIIPYAGDASVLAHVMKTNLPGMVDTPAGRAQFEEMAFKVATCRWIDRASSDDLAHLADAWALINASAR